MDTSGCICLYGKGASRMMGNWLAGYNQKMPLHITHTHTHTYTESERDHFSQMFNHVYDI